MEPIAEAFLLERLFFPVPDYFLPAFSGHMLKFLLPLGPSSAQVKLAFVAFAFYVRAQGLLPQVLDSPHFLLSQLGRVYLFFLPFLLLYFHLYLS